MKIRVPRSFQILLDATAITALRYYVTKKIALYPPKQWINEVGKAIRALFKDTRAVVELQKYVASRIALNPEAYKEMKEFEKRIQQFIDVIEQIDTRMWEYLTDKEKKRARSLAQHYPEFVVHINADNVLKWLMTDVPIAYGILKGHPKGVEWLEKTLSKFVQEMMGYQIEIVEVGSD